MFGPVRILVISNFFPPEDFGGYERSCLDVVERWAAAGHEISVLTSDTALPGRMRHVQAALSEQHSKDRQSSRPPIIHVERSLRLYWNDHLVLSPSPPGRLLRELHNRRRLRQLIERFAPEVVSIWGMGGMSLSLLSEIAVRRLPAVLVICDEWPLYAPDMDAWIRPFARLDDAAKKTERPRSVDAKGRRMLTSLARMASRHLDLPATALPPLGEMGPACFVSAWLRDQVIRQARWKFTEAPVVYSGIDHESFRPRPLSSEFGQNRPAGSHGWSWRLLYAGRLDPRKGVDTVIRAFARLGAGATLRVDGRGDSAYLQELESLAGRLGVLSRVTFANSSREQLAQHYRNSDAVLFASTWEEPLGLVPLEAMACGTPVVATARGGSAEYLVHGLNCLVCKAGDDAAMARAIERLAGDETLRARLVEGGLETARLLGIDELASYLLAWHEAAAAGPEAPRPAPRRPPSELLLERVRPNLP